MDTAENKTLTEAQERESPEDHTRQNQALRDSEERYRAVIQQVSEAIFLLDVESMRLLEANPAFQRMLGYSEEEVPGLSIYDLLPYDRERINRATQRAMEEGNYQVNDRLYRCKDGTLINVEVGITPITYAGRRVLCEVLRDISERKSAEEALRNSEKLFRAMVHNSADAIALARPDGTFQYVSPGVTGFMGYSPDELVGRSAFELLPEEDLPGANAVLEEVLASPGKQVTIEAGFRHKDGKVRWLEITITNMLDDPAVGAIIANFRDLTESKRVQEELRRSRDQLEVILRGVQDGITVQAANGQLIFANDAALRILGFGSQEEMLNTPVGQLMNRYELLGEDGNPVILEELPGRRALQGLEAPEKMIGWRHLASGEVRWSLLKATPVKDDQGRVQMAINIFSDMTEQKKAEDAIRESEARFRLIVENSQDIITMHDAQGRYVYVSPSVEQVLGYKAENLLGRTPKDPVHPDDLQDVQRALAKSISGEQTVLSGYRIKHANGEWRYFESSAQAVTDEAGKPHLIVAVSRDITERLEAEKALRQANRRFDLAARAVNALIYEWDIQENKVYHSPGLYGITGFHPEEAPSTGEWWDSRIHPDDKERAVEQIHQGLDQEDGYSLEYRVQHKNGNYVYVWDRGLIERDDSGKAVRVVGSTLDITERKELEKRKDDFIALASHELKTPTSTIKGYAQLLGRNRQLAADERTMRRLKNLDLAADRLAQLVNEMLDLSRIERGQFALHMQPLDLAALVKEVVTEMRLLTDRHTIKLHPGEGADDKQAITVSGDPERLRQVITNLIENAIKYSPRGGVVDVYIRRADDQATVSVKDGGIGISDDQISRIFERFYRAPDVSIHNYAGMGLGLSISYEIVKRHSGEMWAESSPGAGSTFSFRLPT